MMLASDKKGFTLIELLVVMVIIGLVSSLVLPSMYRQVLATKEQSEFMQLGNIVNRAKTQSYFLGKTFRINFVGDKVHILEMNDLGGFDKARDFVFEHLTFGSEGSLELHNGRFDVYDEPSISTLRGMQLSLVYE